MGRAVIPHGDRRDGAESGCVEDEKASIRPLNENIVRVLVLGEDLGNRARRRLSAHPLEDIAERALLRELDLKVSKLRGVNVAGGGYGNLSQMRCPVR